MIGLLLVVHHVPVATRDDSHIPPKWLLRVEWGNATPQRRPGLSRGN